MRDYTQEEKDLFSFLWTAYGDWSIVHECMAHVKPYLRDEIHVVKVYVEQRTPDKKINVKKHKWDVKAPLREGISVHCKLSDGALLTVTLAKAYFVKSVLALAGWEQTEAKKDKPKWHVYVVRCADNSLYCGTTTDVIRRVAEHNTSPRGAKYTRSRRPVSLVQSWPMRNRSEAVKAELRFKALPKHEKEQRVRPNASKS